MAPYLKAKYVLRPRVLAPAVLAAMHTKDVIVWPNPGPKGYVKIRKFKKFKKLPPEIQTMIWKMAVDDLPSRTLVVTRTTGNVSLNHTYKMGEAAWQASVIADVPAMLRVNIMSRSIAKEKYKLVFDGPSAKHPVYFNAVRDNIHFISTADIPILLGQFHAYSILDDEHNYSTEYNYCKKCPKMDQTIANVLFKEVRSVSIDCLDWYSHLKHFNAM